VLSCGNREFSCPAGYKCVSDFCVPQRCAQVTCASGMKCDENTGTCVDLCAGVNCASPKVCILGRCLDCESPPLTCDQGQICYGGVCKADPCMGVTCANGSYCSNGQCVDTCIPGKCPAGNRCVAGQCIADKCDQVACAPSQYCDPATGECKTDRCEVTQCGPGERCVSTTGLCAPDPCRLIDCPSDCWTCGTTADGTGTCLLKPECQQTITQVGQRGGGTRGFSCAVGGDGGGTGVAWPVALLLGAAVAFAARRRRSR
jgi:MYXO-CTERM domain-containing protein